MTLVSTVFDPSEAEQTYWPESDDWTLLIVKDGVPVLPLE